MYRSQENRPMASFTTNGAVVKDHHYYKMHDNNWNNPVHANKKQYYQYHHKNELHKEDIAKKRSEEGEILKIVQEARIKNAIIHKGEALARHQKRVKERELVQLKSKQNLSDLRLDNYDDYSNKTMEDYVAKRADSMRHARQNENMWNNYSFLSKKHLHQVITPVVIKGEEVMMSGYKKALEKEKQVQARQLQRMETIREDIRQTMKSQKLQNMQFHETHDLIPSSRSTSCNTMSKLEGMRKSSMTISPIAVSRESSQINNLNFAHTEPRSQTGKSTAGVSIIFSVNPGSQTAKAQDNVERLSIPKKRHSKKFDLAELGLKGSLIKNIEKGNYYSESKFRKLLVAKSRIIEDHWQDSHREPSPRRTESNTYRTKGTIIVTTQTIVRPTEDNYGTLDQEIARNSEKLSRINEELVAAQDTVRDMYETKGKLNTKRHVLDEMDAFDRKIDKTLIKVGYPRAKLVETEKPALDLLKPAKKRNLSMV